MNIQGMTKSNYVQDSDAFLSSFDDAAHAQAILDVLRSNVSLEDNGFRNLDEGLMNEQGDAKPGEADLIENLKFYLGDSRAWRDGWKPESFARHQRRASKARSCNGVSFGPFSLIEEKPKHTKEEKRQADLDRVGAILAKRQAKRQAKAAKLGF